MVPICEQLRQLEKEANEYSSITNKLAKAKALRDQTQHDIDEKKSEIHHIIGNDKTDSDVQEMFDEAVNDLERGKNKIEDIQDYIKANREKLTKLEYDLRMAANDLGRRGQDQKRNRDNMQKLQYINDELAQKYNWDLNRLDESQQSSVGESEEAMDEVIRQIAMTVKESETNMRKITANMEKDVDAASKVVQEFQTKKELVKNKKETTQTSMIQKKKEMAEIKRKLKLNEEAAEKLTELKNMLSEKSTKLESLRSDNDLDELNKIIANKEVEKKKLDKKYEEINNELHIIVGNQATISKLEIKKKDLKTKESDRSRIFNKRREDFETLFGEDDIPKDEDLAEKCQTEEDILKQSKASADNNLANLKTIRDKAIANKSTFQAEKDAKKRKVEECKEKLMEGLDGDENADLKSVFADTKDQVEEARQDLQVREAKTHTYRDFLKRIDKRDANNHKACPTCSRAFEDDQEAQELKEFFEREIKQIPKKLANSKKKLEALEFKLEVLRDLLPVKDSMDQLTEELAKVDLNLKSIQRSINDSDCKIKTIETDQEEVNEKLGILSEIQSDLSSLKLLLKDTRVLKDEVNELSRTLEGTHSSSRSLDTVKEESNTLSRKIKALSLDIESKRTKERKMSQEIIALEKSINDIRSQTNDLERNQNEASSLEAKFSELNQEVEALKEERAVTENDLADLEDEIVKANRLKNNAIHNKDKEVTKAREATDLIKKEEGKVHSLVDQIREYDESNNERQLKDVEEKISKLKNDRGIWEGKVKAYETKLKEAQVMVEKLGSNKEDLYKNIKLREKMAQLESHMEDVLRWDENLKTMRYDEVQSGYRDLKKKQNIMNTEIAKAQGSIDTLKAEIKKLKIDMDNPRLKDAAKNFREKAIEMRLTQHVIKDLETVNFFFIILY